MGKYQDPPPIVGLEPPRGDGLRVASSRAMVDALREENRITPADEPLVALLYKYAEALDLAPTSGRGAYAVGLVGREFRETWRELRDLPAPPTELEAETYDVELFPLTA